MTTTREYWLERTLADADRADLTERQAIRKIQKMHKKVFKEIEKDIMVLFQRYAEQNELTYEQAIELLTNEEYTEFRMDIAGYMEIINHEGIDEEIRENVKLEYNTLAMKSRISRLEELTYRVKRNLDTLFFYTHDVVKELLERSVTESYRYSHSLRRTPSIRDYKLYEILQKPWSGQNYSGRIWTNRNQLAGIAQNEITKGLYQGKSSKEITKDIANRMDGSLKNIERVVRTEGRFARNEAAAQAYMDMGYEWYEFSSHTEGRSSGKT